MKRIFVGILVSMTAFGPVTAQESIPQTPVLKEIRDTADDICDKISHEQTRTEADVNASIEAKVNGVINKLLGLDVKGAADLKRDQSTGVLQQQLAIVVMHTGDCRHDVFNTLVMRMLPPGDVNCARLLDQLNIARTAFSTEMGSLRMEYRNYITEAQAQDEKTATTQQDQSVARAKTDRSDSKCLFPARCGVIHHACWRGGQHA
jgi:hypothetical protein